MNINILNVVDAEYDDNRANLADVWAAVDTPIYRVVDEDGVNVGSGCCRRLTRGLWLYCDDTDGHSLLTDDHAERLFLVPDDKHVPYGWNRNGEVVAL